MSHKVTDFPQFRKLSNEKVFYRIRDERNFDEIQLIGSRAMWFSMEATQYPEILKIQDLLSYSEGVLASKQEEFDALRKQYDLG